MDILFSIDDTDMPGTPGTGQLAQTIAEEIQSNGWGTCARVSRHQLFVHEDVPYTSHNSAMCFSAAIPAERLDRIVDFGKRVLEEESIPGSDPGLCVVIRTPDLDRRKLSEFGHRAKQEVLTKVEAYSLAEELGVHLTEHGGTGQGVIGALAGCGLRLSGNDGRFRGWYHFGKAGETITVNELCSHDFIDSVRSEDGAPLSGETRLILGDDKIKTVFQEGKQVVLAAGHPNAAGNTGWTTLTKKDVKRY